MARLRRTITQKIKPEKSMSADKQTDDVTLYVMPDETKQAIQDRKIWDLSASGRTISTIVKESKLSLHTVESTLSRLYKEYRASIDADVDRFYTRHIVVLEQIVENSMRAWDDQVKQFRGSPRGPNHNYLLTAMTALQDIRKITGTQKDDDGNSGSQLLDQVLAFVDAKTKAKNIPGAR